MLVEVMYELGKAKGGISSVTVWNPCKSYLTGANVNGEIHWDDTGQQWYRAEIEEIEWAQNIWSIEPNRSSYDPKM